MTNLQYHLQLTLFSIRWVGGPDYPQGGRFPEGSQNLRLKALAAERKYRFVVVSECCSDITNLRAIETRELRVYMAGQSSLNTLKALEDLLHHHPSIDQTQRVYFYIVSIFRTGGIQWSQVRLRFQAFGLLFYPV